MRISFTAPTTSMGLWFGNDENCCGDYSAFLSAYSVAGLVGTISVLPNKNDYADQFIGFNSSVAISKVEFTYGPGSVGLYRYIDDVQFNNAEPGSVVPEPATVFLLATGLVVTGVVARRRRR